MFRSRQSAGCGALQRAVAVLLIDAGICTGNQTHRKASPVYRGEVMRGGRTVGPSTQQNKKASELFCTERPWDIPRAFLLLQVIICGSAERGSHPQPGPCGPRRGTTLSTTFRALARPLQTTGKAKEVIGADTQGKAQGLELCDSHFLFSLLVPDILPSGTSCGCRGLRLG